MFNRIRDLTHTDDELSDVTVLSSQWSFVGWSIFHPLMRNVAWWWKLWKTLVSGPRVRMVFVKQNHLFCLISLVFSISASKKWWNLDRRFRLKINFIFQAISLIRISWYNDTKMEEKNLFWFLQSQYRHFGIPIPIIMGIKVSKALVFFCNDPLNGVLKTLWQRYARGAGGNSSTLNLIVQNHTNALKHETSLRI